LDNSNLTGLNRVSRANAGLEFTIVTILPATASQMLGSRAPLERQREEEAPLPPGADRTVSQKDLPRHFRGTTVSHRTLGLERFLTEKPQGIVKRAAG